MLRVTLLVWYHVQLEIKYYWARNTVQLQAIGTQTLKP